MLRRCSRGARGLLVLCLTVLPLAACASYQISHDYDVEADFGRYHTWEWMPLAPDSTASGANAALARNSLVDRRIRVAVESAMKAHGFAADTAQPDVVVAYHTGISEKMDITDWGYYYDGNYWGWEGRDIDVENYTEGTLVVDLLDAASHQLVWRGVATGEIHPQRTPQERDRVMKEVVAKMFEKYPPKR